MGEARRRRRLSHRLPPQSTLMRHPSFEIGGRRFRLLAQATVGVCVPHPSRRLGWSPRGGGASWTRSTSLRSTSRCSTSRRHGQRTERGENALDETRRAPSGRGARGATSGALRIRADITPEHALRRPERAARRSNSPWRCRARRSAARLSEFAAAGAFYEGPNAARRRPSSTSCSPATAPNACGGRALRRAAGGRFRRPPLAAASASSR